MSAGDREALRAWATHEWADVQSHDKLRHVRALVLRVLDETPPMISLETLEPPPASEPFKDELSWEHVASNERACGSSGAAETRERDRDRKPSLEVHFRQAQLDVRFRPVDDYRFGWERQAILPVAPRAGDLLNLDGHPFWVGKVSWCVDSRIRSVPVVYVHLADTDKGPAPWQAPSERVDKLELPYKNGPESLAPREVVERYESLLASSLRLESDQLGELRERIKPTLEKLAQVHERNFMDPCSVCSESRMQHLAEFFVDEKKTCGDFTEQSDGVEA